MIEPVFVDTDVLVYLRDPSDPRKQRRAAEVESARRIEDRLGFSWWDSLSVAHPTQTPG